MIVSWFSAGASSAVATKLAIEKYGRIKIIYTHIEDQHEDTLRFIADCAKWFHNPIETLMSPLKSVENACLQSAFVNSPHGAACTGKLKKRVRKEWELNNPGEHLYIWGFDLNEKDRAERVIESMPDYQHEFPLIDHKLTKSEVHGMIERVGIKRPAMYDLGYPNNNCIGCIKGGQGYWNKIRIDFPEVFKNRCEMERKIGGKIFKEFYLDELPEHSGRELKIIVPDCGLFCEILE
jgi:3'-phosphoadenosine 5'-phosphosulfate sulfotransferase (PAPS reductase)/FAD synthetase